MKAYKVSWAPIAVYDLRSVLGYISKNNLINAKKILNDVETKAKTIALNPFRGRKLPELVDIPHLPIREVIISPWRLVYRVQEKEIQILAFLDSRRDLQDILADRLINKKL
jgi:toxin ParE1/3/4